jgi:K(+)-stimulated pyrophosphate-energized sodium pump
METTLILQITLGSSLLGLLVAAWLARGVLATHPGTAEMEKISGAIQEGANAYLRRQFKSILLVIVFLAAFLYLTAETSYLGIGRTVAFLAGSLFSALVGTIGMNIATRANTRVAQAATRSYREAMVLAFRAGATTGMLTIGLGLLGATVIYWIYKEQAAEILVGFGFGGSLLALFMRVGGGIYTKAADVGADLVGKVEKGIPEDDPRNAAVIADLVGDNVGDCAGMAADIFESYEVTLVAAMILGGASFGLPGVLFPLAVRALGIFTSILGIFSVRPRQEKGMQSIIIAFVVSALVSIAGFFLLSHFWIGDLRFFAATTVGIALAVVIFLLTDYFTGDHTPVKEIVKSTQTGPATTILSGLVGGFESTVWALLTIVVTIIAAFLLFGDPLQAAYAISLAGMGMLTTTGLIVSMDSFGPIADNAQGIAEMTKMRGKSVKILPALDSIGNTTKATTKGFAIASAVVAATALFESFVEAAGIEGILADKPVAFAGLLIGGAVPFLFSALTIEAVSKAAFKIVNEVRRQFKEIKGLMEGTAKPDYSKAVDISTTAAQKALIPPALIAVLTPILIGLVLKEEALGAFLIGTILTGQLLAVFMSNVGGAWDNAKKMIEEGMLGGKGSEAHKAGVVGDTVGDPLKDTSGPAINPLIKVINLVSLLAIPLILDSKEGFLPTHWAITIIGLLILVAVIVKSKRDE